MPESGRIATRSRGRIAKYLPLLLGALVIGLTFELGQWQMRRAAEKGEIERAVMALENRPPVDASGVREPQEWLPVRAQGRWLAEATVLLDNRMHAGRPGLHVFSALQLSEGGQVVLVKRGWVAAAPDRSQVPEVHFPDGLVTVSGVVRKVDGDGFTLAHEAGAGMVWQYMDLPLFRSRYGLEIEEWVLEQHDGVDDGLVREWTRPDAGIDRHRGYAFQWYAMAFTALILMVIHGTRSFSRTAR